MSDLIFTLNAVMPIISLVCIGYILKKIGLITKGGAKEMNKLVFKLFLPVMLFLNVYKLEAVNNIRFGYIFFVCCVVILLFLLSLFCVRFVTDDNRKKGALVQSAFRSNYALIGIPLAISLYGDEGSALASLLSAFTIPLFNILAVIELTAFSKDKGNKTDVKKILLGIVKNPLIDAIFLGLVFLLIRYFFVGAGIEFRLSNISWLYKILSQLSAVASPLALIVLGAEFEFSAIPNLKKEIIFGTVSRCVAAPIIGLSLAFIIGGFTGAEFAAFISVFGTSIAVSTVPMAQEMDSDVSLTGQLVVWTTIVSAFTLFVFIYILRILGVF